MYSVKAHYTVYAEFCAERKYQQMKLKENWCELFLIARQDLLSTGIICKYTCFHTQSHKYKHIDEPFMQTHKYILICKYTESHIHRYLHI